MAGQVEHARYYGCLLFLAALMLVISSDVGVLWGLTCRCDFLMRINDWKQVVSMCGGG